MIEDKKSKHPVHSKSHSSGEDNEPLKLSKWECDYTLTTHTHTYTELIKYQTVYVRVTIDPELLL